VRLLSNGPGETFQYGLKLGRLLHAGDIVCLFGDLGSGKTTLVKGIASALAISERDITSASFTIIAVYQGTLRHCSVPFYHIDLYRIKDAGDLDSIGIEEYIGGDGIAVIEWAERMGTMEDSITVKLNILDGEKREIAIEGIDEKDWNNL
jgi:tRNA threonylcarbamoyladenosine biosynthesis protein TsaE